MKKVFNTNEETVAAFLHGIAMGRNPKRSILFMDGVLYSYGPHYPLAIRSGDIVFVNEDRYSVTTSHHAGLVRRLCASLALTPAPMPDRLKAQPKGL